MNGRDLQQSDAITLVGGGTLSNSILSDCLRFAPRLAVADGAADVALDYGVMPEWVLGDLDSLSDDARGRIDPDRIIETPDQNKTDFHKALEWLNVPLVLGVGFMGGRLDHELACYNALVRTPRRCVLVGEVDICFHVPRALSLSLPVGTRFSLFPMAEVKGHCSGLKWPVEGLTMAPWDCIGTSNEVVCKDIHLSFDRPGMLVILPRMYLGPVIAAVMEQG
ncbi:thiamine diphosphokinase [Aliiroseovarius sp. KMU-50]|uniref:Thiamine diphosphokinase n=1 Tax=Aliiroseovarius salicola TaxID=3009082 RepID=A0ABT4W2F8_9RHOB|nr:thiamine diphosphokinase [Aliiroseovarius sp. KMU-50]MDA5093977.1 thiamine diphosphokinase [Aliiroseovarius sp. KMU-50]